MQEEPRVTDHTPVVAAARDDAGREGARYVHMTIGALWRLAHRLPRPRPSPAAGEPLDAAAQPR